ncbi:saccharopine dehydrogenase-like oxidoreductase isoform X2 [Dermacentor silvarum]|uniref:saccharopine dehydrogenase-like oxidoreductase isoform X2 n=1 Tax=Dermacentor silvarum TaxID=543639 RepID=UPI0021008740|nr:saccharopine dehydrogenase-like oxidoreductase isoform X2 [Dermacentor silvarum]
MISSRELDIVLFGATGIAGTYVVEELHRASEGLRWGIAGRSADKLRRTLRAAAKNLDLQEDALDSVPIIVADVADEASLVSMAQRTRLVLNTVGPYRFFGRPVVKACVDSSTHHIDISAEPQYMEQMQLEFYEEARKKGIMILNACGFASIPAETCLSYMRKHFQGDLEEVESYLLIKQGSLGMKVNFGTWKSIIHMLAHASELADLRRQNREKLFTKPLPQRLSRLTRRYALFWTDVAKSWCVPYMGCDRSVMLRSEMFRHQLCGLKPFPGIFSAGTVNRGGPTKEQALGCSFSLTVRGRGWKEKLAETGDRHSGKMNHSITIRLDGPDPAYVATSTCMVQVAVVVLKEKKKMVVEGGVLSPGVALDGTSYLDRIQQRGFHITVVSQRG